ncbi:STM4014 family protein [Inediibacterium massiliense]|uniref:STM4014 family protein n=1 Tax=Inediibacterium massiliense TaxID=1658111 RepID=UPI0006B476F6|nr:STM4014 family protein [Inediibacterium massiliense]
MKIHLIGLKDTKRYTYFLKACNTMEANLEFWDIHSSLAPFIKAYSLEDVVKIDPPHYKTSNVNELNSLVQNYKSQLDLLASIDSLKFMNTPQAIWNTLDKKTCKEILERSNIPTTPRIPKEFISLEELKQYMLDHKIYNVFIKPRFGSGAAGVMAYRLRPKWGEEILQTCLTKVEEHYNNTKKIRKIKDKTIIKELIDFILSQDAIVERWIPKPKVGDIVYDLRAVYQFGKLDYLLARGAKDLAITNLHLNNHALELKALNLSDENLSDMESICKEAISKIPGLHSVGIDLILSIKNKKPMIIEMNGQGDLLYKDIYNDNNIYKNQVQYLKNI